MSNNYSAFKSSKFADESIKQLLRAGTIKEFLTKTMVTNPLSV